MKRICVISPMFGFGEVTRKCIDMTFQNAGVEVDILVVDDGSPEPFIVPENSRFQALMLKNNSGFTTAVNQGILWCGDRYDYLHLLTNY